MTKFIVTVQLEDGRIRFAEDLVTVGSREEHAHKFDSEDRVLKAAERLLKQSGVKDAWTTRVES